MTQQYGAGVAEALAKKREESTLIALSLTNRLSKYAPYMCVYAVLTFSVWSLGWLYFNHECTLNLFTPAEDEAFRSFSFASSGAFAASFVFQIMQLFDSSVKGSIRSAPVYCTALINLLSFCTHLSLAHGLFPVLVSPLGRMSHVIRWGEWLCVAPVLMVMMQSLDVRTQGDMHFLAASTLLQLTGVLAGFFSSYVATPTLAIVLLSVQGVCNAQIFYIAVRALLRYKQIHASMGESYERKLDQSPLHQMISSKLKIKDASRNMSSSNLNDGNKNNQHYSELAQAVGSEGAAGGAQRDSSEEDILGAVKNVGVIIAFKLSVYCCVTWLLHLAVEVVALLGGISHFHEAVLLSLLDILDKCLYVRVLCSGHGTAVSPEGLLTRMLVLEERANASIRLFMRFIFHEVSSPLNSINMGLECLKDEELDEEGRETLNTVLHSAQEIQDVLEMFRAQKSVAANLHAKLKPLNLKELVRTVVNKHVEVADGCDVSLLLALDPRIPEVLLGNESGLRIAINSFVVNGLAQATKPGGSCTVIAELRSKTRHSLHQQGQQRQQQGGRGDKVSVLLSVRDDGPGLSAADVEAAFTPFGRLKPGNASRSTSGGEQVSLSAAKQILEVHGAKVGCESALGKGSTFFFQIDLPLPVRGEEQTNFLTTEILNVDDGDDQEGNSGGRTAGGVRAQVSSSASASWRNPSNRRVGEAVQSREFSRSESNLSDRAYEPAVPSPPSALRASTTTATSAASTSISTNSVTASIKYEKKEEVQPAVEDAAVVHTALLVDDVKSNRRMYGRVLELLGFQVTTADDGLEALAAVKAAATAPYSLILIDHSMPNLEGCDAIKQLRGEGYAGQIIGLSGTDDNAPEFWDAGVNAVITKPVDVAKLQDAVERLGFTCKKQQT